MSKNKRVSVYHAVCKFNGNRSFLYTLRNRNKWFFLVGDIEDSMKNVGGSDSVSDVIRRRSKEKMYSSVIMVN